ncbi:MAG: hypothetical protein EAX95_03205 [Candidatus Thorarchaeota archaeon]|nr:hypothetical protein [Candidatus Thorarchaeota archaeon]
MIVTVTTVVVLVIGILSLALALYGGYVSSEIVEDIAGDSEQQLHAEQRYYLLGMIGIIVLVARLLNAPVFFWMLQSLVPYCPGAMCSYGVVNVGNPWSTIALVLKITLPFAYGSWLVLEIGNRREPHLVFMRDLARSFLVVLVPLILLDSAMDVLLVASIRPVYAPCCSSVYDVDPPFSPSAILGPEVGWIILTTTIVLTLLLIAIQWVEVQFKPLRRVVAVLAVVVSILYLVTLHDTYAPVVLGLSSHHCPYCLFQEFPDTALFAGLFWVGVASAGWRVLLESVWMRKSQSGQNISSIIHLLRKISSIALLFSMVSMVSHLLLVL